GREKLDLAQRKGQIALAAAPRLEISRRRHPGIVGVGERQHGGEGRIDCTVALSGGGNVEDAAVADMDNTDPRRRTSSERRQLQDLPPLHWKKIYDLDFCRYASARC